VSTRLFFSSSKTKQLLDSVLCPLETKHKTSEIAHTSETTIFSHIEHIVHNYFATFHCVLGFLKFLTFSWWSLCKYGASLADGILGLIIEVVKGGISSN
jgi:hypothetical protein